MKKSTIILASLLLVVVLASSFVLVACDKVPEKYKMKNFYGTYDQFANDYYTVYFSLNGKQGTTDLTMRWWDICELKENSFIYIDFSGEKKEQECDAALIAKIRELQQRIGHNVTIERKKITFVDSNTVLKAEKVVTKFNGHYYYSAMYDSDGDNLFDGHYENEQTNNERKIITVVAKNTTNIQGNEWHISIAKSFI